MSLGSWVRISAQNCSKCSLYTEGNFILFYSHLIIIPLLIHIELLSPMLTLVDTYYLTADERCCSRCSSVAVWWWTAQFWVLVTAVVLLSCCGGVINSSHPGRDASSEQCLLPSPLLSIHLAPHPRSRNYNTNKIPNPYTRG